MVYGDFSHTPRHRVWFQIVIKSFKTISFVMGFLKIPSHLEGMSDYWDRDGFWMARKFWQEICQKT